MQKKVNPQIISKELAAIVGISSRRVQGNIAKLKSLNIIERAGSDRSGFWKLNSPLFSHNGH